MLNGVNEWQQDDGVACAWDDVTGTIPDAQEVNMVREDDMKFIRNMGLRSGSKITGLGDRKERDWGEMD